MQIELLWIIPIVAFSFFIFLLVYFAQKKNDGPDRELSREVSRYNSGLQQLDRSQKQPQERLNELERAILLVSESISNQTLNQQVAQTSSSASEIDELKKKLRELYKELDIIASENYSLRAKVKKLLQEKDSQPPSPIEAKVPETGKINTSNKVNLKLYEDTRLLNINTLEDTSEIDLTNKAD